MVRYILKQDVPSSLEDALKVAQAFLLSDDEIYSLRIIDLIDREQVCKFYVIISYGFFVSVLLLLFFVHHVGHAGLKLSTWSNPPALASQSAEITGVSYHAWPVVFLNVIIFIWFYNHSNA